MPTKHRLTVNGRDYFLPDPVGHIKSQILQAVTDGGGYVHIPPIHGGSGLEILFSPGMPVAWSSWEVHDDDDPAEGVHFPDFAEFA